MMRTRITRKKQENAFSEIPRSGTIRRSRQFITSEPSETLQARRQSIEPQQQPQQNSEPVNLGKELIRAQRYGHNLGKVKFNFLSDTGDRQIQATSDEERRSQTSNQAQETEPSGGSEEWYKEFAKHLVAVYRIMDGVTKDLGKSKNKEALKTSLVGLGKAGVQIATMLTGLPGLLEAVEAGGKLVFNVGADTQQYEEVNTDLEQQAQNTSRTGKSANIIKEKIGTIRKASKTLLNFIPLLDPLNSVAKGAKLARQSDDDWEQHKDDLIDKVEQIIDGIEVIIAAIDLEKFGSLKVPIANKIIFVRKTKRDLQSIVEKYRQKKEKLSAAIAERVTNQLRPMGSDQSSNESVPILGDESVPMLGDSKQRRYS